MLDRVELPEGRDEGFEARVATEVGEFERALADDLNVSGAFGAVFRLVREAHVAMDKGELPAGSRPALDAALARIDSVLAVAPEEQGSLDAEIEDAIRRREEARKSRDFAESDRIRDELAARGILLEDSPEGTIWKRKLTATDN